MRVYIAGPITAKSHYTFCDNVKRGMATAQILLAEGFYPFCPHLDFMLCLSDPYRRPGDERLRQNSMEWLRQCEAILLLPGWEDSRGCREEIKETTRLKIPILKGVDKFLKWAERHVYREKVQE